MRLGIHLPQVRSQIVPGPVLADAARGAEAAGADDLWVSDHVVVPVGSDAPPEAFHDALTVLTWAAACTGRVGLGTSVLVAPYRHPVALARSLASLDALSGGRVIAGLASGWMQWEFDALGVPFAERGARTDEAIAVCRALWAGEPDFDGRFTQLRGASITPPPARAGGPPVWVGGNSRAGIARAARVGAAWHTTRSDPDRLAPAIAALRQAEADAGRCEGEVLVSVRVRADVDEVARLAPRLAAIGVAHLLVDLPAFDADRYGDQVAALRQITSAV